MTGKKENEKEYQLDSMGAPAIFNEVINELYELVQPFAEEDQYKATGDKIKGLSDDERNHLAASINSTLGLILAFHERFCFFLGSPEEFQDEEGETVSSDTDSDLTRNSPQ